MTLLACVDIFPLERVIPVAIAAVTILGIAGAGAVSLVISLFRG